MSPRALHRGGDLFCRGPAPKAAGAVTPENLNSPPTMTYHAKYASSSAKGLSVYSECEKFLPEPCRRVWGVKSIKIAFPVSDCKINREAEKQ